MLRHTVLHMQRQMIQALWQQEAKEQHAYQSSAALRAMIQEDFSNSSEVLRAMDRFGSNFVQLFRLQSLELLSDKTPIPIRTCRKFQIHKHTVCQIPYLHGHDYYELIYVLQGNCIQRFQGDRNPLRLSARQACLVSPGVTHLMERCSREDMIVKCSIPVFLYQKIVRPLLPKRKGQNVIVFDRGSPQMEWFLFLLWKECVERREFSDAAIQNYLSLFFIELTRAPTASSPDIVVTLYTYFEDHASQMNLHGFAAQIGYSEDHAARLLKRSTGKSFLELVLELKVARAAKLLLETDDPVSHIARQLGYANPSGFYKQFFRTYGMTPTEYRRRFAIS